MYRVSFTGYRPSKLPFFGEDDPLCLALKQRLYDTVEKLVDSGACDFYSGMALGVDIWAAEAVLKLGEKRAGITLTAILPCRGQELKWSHAEQQRYHDILSRCSKIIYVSKEYTNDCMHKRNRALVDICDVLVAVYDGKKGGTQYTCEYARKRGRRIITLDPII